MNDEQLQREIEQALAVEPSPQFIARVRRQIANEPRPSKRFRGLAFAAGIAAVLVGILLFRPWTSKNLAPEQTVSVPLHQPEVSNPPVSDNQQARPGALLAPVQVASRMPETPKGAAQPSKPEAAMPEVLIDPREVEAFKEFVEAVERQNIDPLRLESVFDSADRAGRQVITPMPIAGIEPIQIEPLSPAASERGNL